MPGLLVLLLVIGLFALSLEVEPAYQPARVINRSW